jgi:predicted RNase H-like HicB family nuclease
MGFSRWTKLRRSLLATWKLLLSFRKTKWELLDYPVDLVRQTAPANNEARPEWRRISSFRAEIINWPGVSATGDTQSEAIQKLEEVFQKVRRKRDAMPRPGRHVPIDIQFADRERIAAHEHLAEKFTREVLGLEWAWISDESNLWDFTCEDSLDPYYSKIQDLYGVDVSRIDRGNLAEILELIAISQNKKDRS